MDSVIFQAMAIEQNRRLANSRLDKVTQVTAGTLVLKFWTGRDKVQLLVKADGQGAFYETRQAHAAPARPPRFCQLLRARLRRLLEVRAEPFDRVVHFFFAGPDDRRYDLVFEAFGAQGNLVLVDDTRRIVDLLWRQEGKRSLLPGETYHLPDRKERLSLFGERTALLAALRDADARGALAEAPVAPMSPGLARAMSVARARGQSLEALVEHIASRFDSAAFDPMRVTWDEQSGCLPFALDGRHGFTSVEAYPDLSALVEADLAGAGQETARDLAARLAGVISKQRKRLDKRLEHIAAESDRQADPEHLRITGDLLLANLHRLTRGAASVRVEDYYQSPAVPVTIELDERLSPQENAQRYFKLYRKARRAGEHHTRRRQETEAEREWLGQVELSLEEALDADDLYQVQLELETAGLLKHTKGQLGRRQAVKAEDQLHRALAPSGWQLFWGKNSRTNDHVSCSMTGPQDLWFHAKGMPGAHLVLKCGDQAGAVAEVDLLFAAALAAGYSKGKDAGKLEVIVARGRDVKKPKGARPGLVTVGSYRTVMVAPKRLDG